MQTAITYKKHHANLTQSKVDALREEADICSRILSHVPNDPCGLHVAGLIEYQLGHLEQAKIWLQKALRTNPPMPDIHCHYGIILMQQGETDGAIDAFTNALSFFPHHVESLFRLGCCLAKKNLIPEAVSKLRRAIAQQPDHVDALNSLGNIMNRQGRAHGALLCYRRILTVRPDYIMAYNNAGLTFATLGDWQNAELFYRQALSINPDYPEVLNNLGIIHGMRDSFDDAIECYRRALLLRPDYPEAHNNLANALKDCGLMGEAISHYEVALAQDPSAEYHHNLALALLAVGRYPEGWAHYEWRWQTHQLSFSARSFKQPQWHGEPAPGKTILLHSEQGFGDTIQFCRYVKSVHERGLRIILEVQPALVSLLQCLENVDRVVAKGDALPDFDLHCPLLSLPLALGTDVEHIPCAPSYLTPAAAKVEAWSRRIPFSSTELRVGLVWAGSIRKDSQDLIATDRRRSLSPDRLAPLFAIPHVQFFSLQKNGPPAPDHFNMSDYMDDCQDFADTAALIASLDLVISVDTAVAHLAAAMGKSVWLLNRFNSCWRWFRHGNDSPWYPSLRIFRQSRQGDWDSVISRVAQELAAQAKRRLVN